MLVAFDLLTKFKKDKKFIQRELDQQKKQSKLIVREDEEVKENKKKASRLDPKMTQEERHKQIAEKREKRKQEQKQKEEEKEQKAKEQRRDDIRKATRQRIENMRAATQQNSDIMMVLDEKPKKQDTFLTQNEEEIDPRQSVRIQKVLASKQAIEAQTSEYQQEVSRMQEEIKKYKDDLRKEQLAHLQREQQRKIKQQMASEKEKMEKEMEKSKNELRNFKLSKVAIMLNSLLIRSQRTHRFQTFSMLQQHSLTLGVKSKKLEKHISYSKRYKIFKLWLTHVRSLQLEREQIEYERQREIELIQTNRAIEKRDLWIKRAGIRSLWKNIQIERAEREIEREHKQRKNKIDMFFTQLKDKIQKEKGEEERLEREEGEKQKLKEALRDIMDDDFDGKMEEIQMDDVKVWEGHQFNFEQQSEQQTEQQTESEQIEQSRVPDESFNDQSLLNLNILADEGQICGRIDRSEVSQPHDEEPT